ncbi:hypothetical protein CAPTEDRAFT_172156 [Capitella teleta]|uniref:Peptidase M20 domain-containing protein 2 n=1 Tax=Capitella teleta TaxID=283909 RepID=R7UB15_CAPTE|nr:hypothetical protein CAPTEDRAFT_172156 [Capitella teleta]|eukprot:ELU03184.1 hypothetical protein CAPTEDRAFT_172156 [Capitella teleta]
MAEELYEISKAAIDAARERLHAISGDIWNHPELNFHEHHAHAVLTKFLEEEGFDVERKFVYDTGFRASYGDGQPTVVLVAEFDALPEIGHACGHNLIAQVALGAAIGVKAAMENTPRGKIVVLGTPAEEGGGGKLGMIQQGVFDDVTCALMAHPAPDNKFDCDGDIFSAATMVKVAFKGKSSHAAAAPYDGVNALDAAVMAYNSISCMRQQLRPSYRVAAIITEGGLAVNIIPELSRMEVAIRAPSKQEVLLLLKPRINACLEGAARATGCELQIEWLSFMLDNMISDPLLVDLYGRHASSLGVEESQQTGSVFTASTDMGNVSQVVPSIHPIFSIGDSSCRNHTRGFAELAGSDTAQPFTMDQSRILANIAIDVLLHPEWIPVMKHNLKSRLESDAAKAAADAL